MKSIRLSLMVYFLGLLALALGVASWLLYETARETLRDKQRASEKHIQTQYQERCREEAKRRDEQLLLEAQTLNKLVQFDKIIRGRELNYLNWTGLALGEGTRNGLENLLSGASIGGWPRPERPERPVRPSDTYRVDRAAELYRHYYDDVFHRVPAIQFNEEELTHDPKNHLAEYFQIDVEWRHDWRSSYSSHSLDEGALPGDPATLFEPSQVLAWKWDEVKLETSGVTVRRVVLKTPSPRNYPYRPPLQGRSPNPPSVSPSPPVERPTEPPQRPTLYIQCAHNVAERDKALQVFAERRDDELATLSESTKESLNTLGTRLLLISAATFAATVVGTWFLVWFGLTPLRRLSDAVSRVSEKDFRLQFNKRRLPSELRPIVERLTNTLGQLARAFTREKQATADISHELRTPLAALLTTTELALRKSRSAEEYRELLADCRLSGQQMNRAVERLLALARLDAGVDTMRPERVDVAQLTEQCAALVRPLAEARGLQLRVHGSDGAHLLADPDKLREVITNLLHNAIQYNRPRGSVDVAVARRNGHLHVEVRDTGIGIKAEAREHIFERFYRADPSRGGDESHAGLGLAIVKGYVDLMGGTIHVDSVEGQGSTFLLQLPVERARSAAEVRGRK